MLNHIHRVIFNRATGCFVAVSEITKAHGKSGRAATVGSVAASSHANSNHSSGGRSLRRHAINVAIAAAMGLSAMSAQAFVCVDSSGGAGFSTATGGFATACGFVNEASANSSSALGIYNKASGRDSTAVGFYNESIGRFSSALGIYNESEGVGSSALGHRNKALGDYSLATGSRAGAIGKGSTAVGGATNTAAFIDNDGAIITSVNGIPVTATGLNLNDITHVSGVDVTTNPDQLSAFINSVDKGGALAFGEDSTAIGANNAAIGDYSSAIGYDNNSIGLSSSAVGIRNISSGEHSLAVGGFNKSKGRDSSAMGYRNSSSGKFSSAIGRYNISTGAFSSALGSQN
ncbi:ESPR-type extended signal peptide-containing protein, partial [Psychrobacter celer]|uniref:ESPR-type extended signal peptide-containing protein n=1 Tax=Psychrobacter celer TaxID=306572 RepID=UPI003FD2E177